MKTFSLKPAEVTREWVVIDAAEAPLGRVATLAAARLIGKHKRTYTAHVDGGDYVVVINADKLITTGNKLIAKKFYRHSGYPDGLTETSLQSQLAKDSTKIIEQAIRGMLPKNKLQDPRLARLKIYKGDTHQHEAQKPVKIGVHA